MGYQPATADEKLDSLQVVFDRFKIFKEAQLTPRLIREIAPFVDISSVFKNYQLPEESIRELMDVVDWDILSKYNHAMSFEFIEEFTDKINWKKLSENSRFSWDINGNMDFIVKHQDKLDIPLVIFRAPDKWNNDQIRRLMSFVEFDVVRVLAKVKVHQKLVWEMFEKDKATQKKWERILKIQPVTQNFINKVLEYYPTIDPMILFENDQASLDEDYVRKYVEEYKNTHEFWRCIAWYHATVSEDFIEEFWPYLKQHHASILEKHKITSGFIMRHIEEFTKGELSSLRIRRRFMTRDELAAINTAILLFGGRELTVIDEFFTDGAA